MSNNAFLRASPKVHHTKEIELNQPPTNTSPTKQKFHTFKNFLRNRGSISDLKAKEKEDIFGLAKPELFGSIRESKSATRLADFKFKVPKKKASLGNLVTHIQQSTKPQEPKEHSDVFSPITPTSPPPNLARNVSVSTKSSKTSRKDPPPSLSFSLDEPKSFHRHSSSLYTPDTSTFSKDWATPASIRGTYVHDWSNNMSPRSLAESIRAGRVESHSPNFQLSQATALDYKINPKFDFMSDSSAEDVNKVGSEMKLDLNDLIEPSHPFPSPCTVKMNGELGDLTFTELNVNETSDAVSCSSVGSSDGSEFSFVVNRAASVRFYKSKEQLQREIESDKKKKETQQMKDFLGNVENTENELLEGFSSNSRKIVDGFDEDFNYIDYDEDDDTDALFNRDLFGVSSRKPHGGLELSFESDSQKEQPNVEFDETNDHASHDETDGMDSEDGDMGSYNEDDNHYNDEYEFKPPGGLELSDDEYQYKPPSGLELSDDEYEYKPPNSLELSDDEYDYKPLARLELTYSDDDEEHPMETQKNSLVNTTSDDTLGNIKSQTNDDSLTTTPEFYHRRPSASLESIVETTEKETSFTTEDNTKPLRSADISSKKILKMLNSSDSGLAFKPFSSEIQIKHTPSAKLQRHRSLKFHQLSGDIEDKYHSGESQWNSNQFLDEVNSIPEDFDYDNDYTILDGNTSFSTNSKKGRLSTLMIPTSPDFITDRNTFPVNDNAKQHVWKHLINNNGSVKNKYRNSERIQLEDKTITLYNHSEHDLQDNSNSSIVESGTSECGELSTIME